MRLHQQQMSVHVHAQQWLACYTAWINVVFLDCSKHGLEPFDPFG